jgi:aminopeptidase N
LLRGFSAPVKVKMSRSEEELAFLLAHDSDAFNRWDAGQQLALQALSRQISAHQLGESMPEPVVLRDALRSAMQDKSIDSALLAKILSLPSESYLADQMDVVDVDAIFNAHLFTKRYLAESLYDEFLNLYQENYHEQAYVFNSEAMAQRSLKNTCLDFLVETQQQTDYQRCFGQFTNANNMTDQQAALAILTDHDTPLREQALQSFYQQWHDDPQVMEKWLSLQAMSRLPNTLQQVKALMQHEAFSIKNPNKVRSLIGGFCRGNPSKFHAIDGSGYALLTDVVLQLNELNPQIAARLVQIMIRWKRYDEQRQQLMKNNLQQILQSENLSKDVYEVVSRSLED